MTTRPPYWYYAALLYFAGMAATGLFIRHHTPENSLNTEHYLEYLAILSVFWPITVVAGLTNGSDF